MFNSIINYYQQFENILAYGFIGIIVVGITKFFFHNNENTFLQKQKELKSIEIPGTKKEGEGPIHRNVKYKDFLIERYDQSISTLYELFNVNASKYGDRPFLGTRKRINENTVGDYEWQTYNQVSKRRDNLDSGLLFIGHQNDETIGIYSINRAEWIIIELACHALRCPSVALYDSLGQNAVEYLLKHAEIKTVFCSKKQFKNLISVAPNCSQLKRIILIDAITEEEKSLSKNTNVSLYSMEEIEKIGSQNPKPHIPPLPEDICTIMYTSGTTGDPKGVLLNHSNLIGEISGLRFYMGKFISSEDVHISYLPLAHSFERTTIYTIISYGACIGFYQGNINELFNDIVTLRPTFILGAPRVWARLRDKLLLTINNSNFLKKKLFYWGYSAKQAALQKGQTTLLWDKIIFNKIKARLGGRVKYILSGSAPLDPSLAEFLKICCCCAVIEGYGLTENAAGAILTDMEDTQFGHVGAPIPCCEVKLQDVPEMGYSSKNNPPTGEIMIRGTNVFKGYYKEPERTKEILEPDGFFHTGDIGKWNSNGTITIIDRKKNIFKLSQGEYVAIYRVEYLENIFTRSIFVSQIWVYGNSFKRFLVAIVVPDKDVLLPWAAKNNIQGDINELCKNSRVIQQILDDLTQIGKQSKIQGYEFIKSILLIPEPFTVENDLLTPTFKLKRNNLIKTFQKEIDEMYKKLENSE